MSGCIKNKAPNQRKIEEIIFKQTNHKCYYSIVDELKEIAIIVLFLEITWCIQQ